MERSPRQSNDTFSYHAAALCASACGKLETGERFKDVKLGLKNAVKGAGLKGITCHACRHTFASRLVQHGADIVTMKELLRIRRSS
jgi:site-specific recombinase XerD